jgi:hypothetical protein
MIGANTKRLVLLLCPAISTSLANALHANKVRQQQIHWRVDGYRVDADFTGQLPAVGLTVKNTALSQCMDSGYIHVEALRSLNAADITAAYEAMLDSSANG